MFPVVVFDKDRMQPRRGRSDHLHTGEGCLLKSLLFLQPFCWFSPGTLDLHGDRSGDYLYALLFMVADENDSWYLDHNIRTQIPQPAPGLKESDDFIESNKMHSEEHTHARMYRGTLDPKFR